MRWVQPWFLRMMRVPDRLARAGHAHRERQQAERGGLLGIVAEQRLVAAHAGEVVDVAGLGHADDRVDQQVRLAACGGAEGQLLVGAVQRVAGLEGDDPAPAELAEAVAQLLRRVAQMREVVVHRRLDALRPGRRDRRCRLVEQVAHGRVGHVVGAEHGRSPRPRLSGCQRSVTVSMASDHALVVAQAMVSPSSSCSAKAWVTSRVIGIGQRVPSASRMSAQTRS